MVVIARSKRTKAQPVSIPGLRLIVWGGYMVVHDMGTLSISSERRSATFVLDSSGSYELKIPRKEIQRWAEVLTADNFRKEAAVLIRVVGGGINGAAIPRYGEIEVTPYEAVNASWLLARDAEDADFDDDLSLYDPENHHRLEIKGLKEEVITARVFDRYDNHAELFIIGDEIDGQDVADSEIIDGGPYFYYPIVPCPPDDEPPRTELVLDNPDQRKEFEMAMRNSRRVFYFVDFNGERTGVRQVEGPDPLISVFTAGDIGIVMVARGYRKHRVPLIIDGKRREFQIRGEVKLV